jgi:putative peptidoglycan lipid II flippase
VKKFSHVTRITLLLASFFFVDKIMAVARQLIIARQFGFSKELDAFNAANNLPDLLYALISGGALAIAFIPVLSEVITQKNRSQAWVLFSRIANLSFLVTAALAVVIAFLAEPLVRWRLGIAPGFQTDLQKLVAELMRLNLIATMIFSLSGLVMASLQANQHFLMPALSPLLYNLGQIFGALVLAPAQGYTIGPVTLPAYGMGVHGLVYGVIIGAVLHLAIQVPALVRYRFKWSPQLGLRSAEVKQVLRLLGPRLLTMFFIQLIFMARDNLASHMEEGAVTALTYGWMMMQVPETIIGTAVGTALLPTLSEFFARRDEPAFRRGVQGAMQVLLALTVPVAVVLGLGVRPLILAAFDFGPRGTDLTVWVTQIYLVGLIAHSLVEVAARAFYSRQEARIPLLASAFTMVIFILVAWLLQPVIGVLGIALANTVAYSGEVLLLFFLLNRHLPERVTFGKTPLHALLGAAAGGAVTILVLQLPVPLPGWLGALAAIGLGGLVSLLFIRSEVRQLARL